MVKVVCSSCFSGGEIEYWRGKLPREMSKTKLDVHTNSECRARDAYSLEQQDILGVFYRLSCWYFFGTKQIPLKNAGGRLEKTGTPGVGN